MAEKQVTEKHRAKLAAFVILEREGKILLSRPLNTGYSDGYYQIPSGHIERDELPKEAAIREAKEEVGVTIASEDLHFGHVSYRITGEEGNDYVDFFFKVTKWTGEPYNAEPEKCDDILWAPISELPSNTVPAITKVIDYIIKELPFSELK